MHNYFSFTPDPVRANLLDTRMRLQLADSLDYLNQSIQVQLDFCVDGLNDVIGKMREGKLYPPSAFGLYYEITYALIDGEIEHAKTLISELLNEQPYTNKNVELIGLNQITTRANIDRYKRLMDTDPSAPFEMEALSEDELKNAIKLFDSSLSKLKRSLPSLANEFEEIIRSVILVKGNPEIGFDFAGGSCYMLWGALFINTEFHNSQIAVIEALAHESAHSLLFGFSIDEPLVLNADEELFSSPLRYDPRPMDGIFHATYVSARMHWAVANLIKSNLLTTQEFEYALDSKQRNQENFYSGYEVVKQHALLTDTGKKLIDSAYAYMESESLGESI